MQSQLICHSLWHFKWIVTSCDIFTHHAFQDLYSASVVPQTYSDHSPISLQPSHSFTHECIRANRHYMQSQLNSHSLWHFKWTVTSCDILNHHAFQESYNASVVVKTLSDHAPISIQFAHSFTHECIHANMHYMQSQLNCHSLWHFK